MAKKKYTPRALMEIAIKEMHKSVPEHRDRTDPLVGAVLATEDGELIGTAYRGELRQGDHAEFTVLERKNRTRKLDGMVIYATLEPCAPGARSSTKLSCAERIVNARIKKVYIGIDDPDPKVKGDGKEHLIDNEIEVIPFDKDLKEEIESVNSNFLKEAGERAKQAEIEGVHLPFNQLNEIFDNYDLSDFSEEALRDFKEKLKLTYEIDSKEFRGILGKWYFLKTDSVKNRISPTGLGILLFGKNPNIPFPQSLVKFTIKTKGSDKPKILDFDGPLVLVPKKIEDYLEINFPKAIDRSTFARSEIKEVYFEVLREVIINAIVHRDYKIEGANVNVKIDDDKIVVDSPGKPLVNIEKLQDFSAPTFSSNPKLANVFYQMGFIEKRNLGMEELRGFSKIMGFRKPSVTYDEPYLRVVIWRSVDSGPTMPEVKTFIKSRRKVSSSEFADHFGLGIKTASRFLNKLVAEGVIGREGTRKGTKYFLLE
ncbi:MAG: hypothetical protein DRJ05_14465 [Bacteroidetes bacterium]|nr:MAG: hypothetical protein DRJ05_14465 [Bacteroidota bacterium]